MAKLQTNKPKTKRILIEFRGKALENLEKMKVYNSKTYTQLVNDVFKNTKKFEV